ncbi:MAG: hypothetical protein IKU67_04050 [Firmicutes bacterium]|nr:hypothetical protein [Bacillota bacterium]
MEQEELKRYYEVYTECWKLLKKYSNPTDMEEFWENLAVECHELNEKFEQKKFASEIILSTYIEIERIWKCSKEKEEWRNGKNGNIPAK